MESNIFGSGIASVFRRLLAARKKSSDTELGAGVNEGLDRAKKVFTRKAERFVLPAGADKTIWPAGFCKFMKISSKEREGALGHFQRLPGRDKHRIGHRAGAFQGSDEEPHLPDGGWAREISQKMTSALSARVERERKNIKTLLFCAKMGGEPSDQGAKRPSPRRSEAKDRFVDITNLF